MAEHEGKPHYLFKLRFRIEDHEMTDITVTLPDGTTREAMTQPEAIEVAAAWIETHEPESGGEADA